MILRGKSDGARLRQLHFDDSSFVDLSRVNLSVARLKLVQVVHQPRVVGHLLGQLAIQLLHLLAQLLLSTQRFREPPITSLFPVDSLGTFGRDRSIFFVSYHRWNGSGASGGATATGNIWSLNSF